MPGCVGSELAVPAMSGGLFEPGNWPRTGSFFALAGDANALQRLGVEHRGDQALPPPLLGIGQIEAPLVHPCECRSYSPQMCRMKTPQL